MQVPDCSFEGFAGLRSSASFDLPATPRAQWHHRGDFVGAVIATGNDPGALTAHAETGHINPVLIDTHYAFDVREEPLENRSIPLGNRLHRRDEIITRRNPIRSCSICTVGEGAGFTLIKASGTWFLTG